MDNNGSIEHPNTETLLDYIDDTCPEQARLHIQHCMPCRKQIDELLQTRACVQQLPAMQPPADLWKRIDHAVAPRPGYNTYIPWLTAAASVIVVTTVLLFSPLQQQVQPVDLDYLALLEQSRQLESALSYLDQQPSVVSLGYAGRLTRIRDSIATIDLALNDEQVISEDKSLRNRLLNERINLLRQLIDQKTQPSIPRYQTF